jgi:hypothetical protein
MRLSSEYAENHNPVTAEDNMCVCVVFYSVALVLIIVLIAGGSLPTRVCCACKLSFKRLGVVCVTSVLLGLAVGCFAAAGLVRLLLGVPFVLSSAVFGSALVCAVWSLVPAVWTCVVGRAL